MRVDSSWPTNMRGFPLPSSCCLLLLVLSYPRVPIHTDLHFWSSTLLLPSLQGCTRSAELPATSSHGRAGVWQGKCCWFVLSCAVAACWRGGYLSQTKDCDFAAKAGLVKNEALRPLLSADCKAGKFVPIASAVLKQCLCNDIFISPLTTDF